MKAIQSHYEFSKKTCIDPSSGERGWVMHEINGKRKKFWKLIEWLWEDYIENSVLNSASFLNDVLNVSPALTIFGLWQ